MNKASLDHWSRLSPLLDVALDMDASERDVWLDTLPPEMDDLKPHLRRLLTPRPGIETSNEANLAPLGQGLLADAVGYDPGSDHLHTGREIAGYRLVRELGRGGMGSVWLAERIDGTMKRQVALKFPYAGPNSRVLAERLGREREILSSLEHANIARLYDAGIAESGEPFLVLEYVDGSRIDVYCDTRRLSTRERVELFLQVLAAVQYAHTRLVIHRDLKPSNILVTEDGVARLLDFGIAKLIPDGQPTDVVVTQIGVRALTPDYASPEQITGQSVTTASDVYSLGVILYQLLTGARPYRLKRESQASLEEAIAEALILIPSRAVSAEAAALRNGSIRDLVRQLRGDLDTILSKALGKQAKDRYASADAFARDLQRSLSNEPVDARPHSRVYLIRKLIARHRLAVAALATVALALTAGIGIATWQAARARASEKHAVAAANTSEAVKQFMIRIFSANTLSQEAPAKARQMNALQLLEAGAARVDVEFAKDPALRKEMLQVIVQLLVESRSGEFEKYALELITLLDSEPGQELKIAHLYIELSSWKTNNDRAMATVYAQKGLQALGPDVDAAHRKEHGNLLYIYAHARDEVDGLDATASLLNEARKLLQSEFSQTAEYARVLEDLGWIELRRNHGPEAVEDFKQSLQALRSDPTVYQHSIARGRYSLATGYLTLKQYADAEREMRDASAIFERSFGAGDSQTAFNNAALGRIVAQEQRFDEALSILHSAVSALQIKNPSFNADYLAAGVEYLATALVWAGRMDEAEAQVPRMVELNSHGSPRDLVQPLAIQSEFDAIRGRWSAAEASARGSVEAATKAYGPDSQRVAVYKNVLGRELVDSGKWQEAGALFAANIQDDGREPGVFNSVSTVARVQRARLLIARGQGQDSLPELRLLWQAYRAQPNNQQVAADEVELRESMGQALMAADNAAEALPHLERAVELRHTQYALSPRLARAQSWLAECKLRLGDVVEAKSLVDKAKSIYASNGELSRQYREPLQLVTRRLAELPVRALN
jgi:serine/threonine-protein kinase